ncbi:hypothetical protein Tco_0855716 [Tanacetum coccineum]
MLPNTPLFLELLCHKLKKLITHFILIVSLQLLIQHISDCGRSVYPGVLFGSMSSLSWSEWSIAMLLLDLLFIVIPESFEGMKLFNQVCLLCEEILNQIPAFNCFCASLDSISAIEDTWERRGIANLAFIQLGWVSRVDEMILARVSSAEAILAIEMLWEWRGIANMAFIQLGWVSRVDEMILARERSGFAGEKVWDDIQVVPGFLGAGKRAFGEVGRMVP